MPRRIIQWGDEVLYDSQRDWAQAITILRQVLRPDRPLPQTIRLGEDFWEEAFFHKIGVTLNPRDLWTPAVSVYYQRAYRNPFVVVEGGVPFGGANYNISRVEFQRDPVHPRELRVDGIFLDV